MLARIADAGHQRGTLRVLAFPSASATLVPPAVGAFRVRMPKVQVGLSEAEPPVSLPALVAGECDIALVYRYPNVPHEADPSLECDALVSDDMAVCVPATHDLAGAGEIRLQQLAREQLIAPCGQTVCREAFERACRTAGFRARVASETSDYMAMQGMVAAGVGVALMPRLVASIAVLADVAVRPLADGVLTRDVSIVTRSGGFRSPAVRELGALLHETAERLARGPLPLRVPTRPLAA